MRLTKAKSFSISGVQMNFAPTFPDAPYNDFTANLTDGNHALSALIIPVNLCSSFLVFGLSISVTANIRLFGGSKNITELFLIFSADITVPPNLTDVLRTNFDGASLRFILVHKCINFSIYSSRSLSDVPYRRKSSTFLRTLKSTSNLVEPSVM